MTKKQSKRAANAEANAVPKGFEQIGGAHAPTWKPEEGDSLEGVITKAVTKVKLMTPEGKKKRRVIELTDTDGERHAIWESATLGEFFDEVERDGVGGRYWVQFSGFGSAKPGQSAPKIFIVGKQHDIPL